MAAEPTLVGRRRLIAVPPIACILAIVILVAFARDRAPAPFAIAALSLIAIAFGPVSRARTARPRIEIVALVAFGLLGMPIGWAFGTSSAFAALFVLALLLAGLFADSLGGWLFFAALAGGQAIVSMLVIAGALGDESVLPFMPPGHPPWHHVSAHLAIQLLYATAFFAGRAFRARYQRLSSELDAAIQVAARRASLVDEARAEYVRTLAIGRHGVFSGQRIGSFRLGDLVGRGGAGEVYDARAEDGTILAVKLVRGDRLRDPAAVRSFIEEANTAMRIESPYVVRAREAGGLDAEIPFLAMEKLDGTDLRAVLAERGALDRAALAELASASCAAVMAVHAAGLVHGDVAPQNLIKTVSGWKLIDFGSRAGAGTPRFTAPELIADPTATPTPASDLYSLAACLYAAATGNDPFAESSSSQLAHAVATRMPIDPRLQGEVADDVARILQIGLASVPSSRFSDAESFCAAFLAAVDGTSNTLGDPLRDRAAGLPAWTVVAPSVDIEPTDVVRARTSSRAIGRTVAASRTSTPAIEPASRTSAPAIEHVDVIREARGTADAHDASDVGIAVRRDDPRDSAVFDATRDEAWQIAFRDKARRQRAGVLAVCIGGAVFLGFIVREREALWAAWIGIAGIAITVGLHRSPESSPRFAQLSSATWPWVIVGALSVGPAFALGLHSGFAAIVALVLFVGRLFRASQTTSRSSTGVLDSQWWILVAILVGHTVAYTLLAMGAIRDLGNTPITYVGLSPAVGWALHALYMGTYVAAFAIAAVIDRHFDRLVRSNEVALRDAAQKEALLSTARAELDRALAGEAGGLFTGSTIGGYLVERLVGRGGMGEVYEARRDGQTVALKVIRADRIAPENLRRFAREASTLRQVESPYVSRVLEIGSEERVPFLAMELVDGATLAGLLRECERLDIATARAMIRDIARGLEDVHRAGVLHRDVKPSNLVRTSERWKLVDFGIAKFVDAPSDTTGNLVMGTPPFMAPEQLTGRAVDARSDLFSFCAVIYRALTGRPAWTTATALAAVRPQPADPGTLVGDDVALALRIGLATQPADRFASSVELGAALDAAFDGRLDPAVRRRALAILTREPWG